MKRVQKTIAKGMAFTLVLSLLIGCASTGTPKPAETSGRSGFLGEYERLKPIEGGDEAKAWRRQNINWKQYNKVLFERILVFTKEDSKTRESTRPI